MTRCEILEATMHGRDVCNHQAIELIRACNLFVACTRRIRHKGNPEAAFSVYRVYDRDVKDRPEICLITSDIDLAERTIREAVMTLADLLKHHVVPAREAAEAIRREIHAREER